MVTVVNFATTYVIAIEILSIDGCLEETSVILNELKITCEGQGGGGGCIAKIVYKPVHLRPQTGFILCLSFFLNYFKKRTRRL